MTYNSCGFFKDQIPPFRSSIALKLIESELGYPAKKLFAKISSEPVAAASLGQVYKATLTSGEPVAVKVQRPGMEARLALDSLLLNIVGGPLQRYLGARGDIVDAVNEMVQHMFDEIDYAKEGQNAERFAVLYGGLVRENEDSIESDNHRRRRKWRVNRKLKLKEASDLVKVPKIYWHLSSKGVLTMEWIDGIKLTDVDKLHIMKFDIQQLVDQGVFSSLRQLLEEGFFHADPHPGNLVVTKEGMLAYFDFGMMGDFPREYRIGLIRTVIAIAEQSSMSGPSKQTEEGRVWSEQDGLGKNPARSWAAFDTRTVVSATSDLFEFILSDEGYRVRVLLVQDIMQSFNTFLDEAFWMCIHPHHSTNCSKSSRLEARQVLENHHLPNYTYQSSKGGEEMDSAGRQNSKGPANQSRTKDTSDTESQKGQGMADKMGRFGIRFSSAFGALKKAVNSAPELWITMLLSFAFRSEAQVLARTVLYGILYWCYNRGSESIWLLLSRMLHQIYDTKC